MPSRASPRQEPMPAARERIPGARRTRRGTRGGTRAESGSAGTRASISRATAPRSRRRDVAGHVDPARGALALDLVRRGHDRDVGHVAERRTRARRRVDRQLAQRREVVRTRAAPQTTTSKIFWSSIDLADLGCPATRVVAARRTWPGVRPKRAAASGRSRTCDLRHGDLRLDLQVGDAAHAAPCACGDLLAPSRAASPGRGRRAAPRWWRWRR